MDKKSSLLSLISRQGILPLYFHKDAGTSIELLKALYSAGIRTVEYTNRGDTALENFKHLRRMCDAELPDMFLGVGTIKNAVSAKAFADAGADYLISPGLVEEVATFADDRNLLWVPGCMTASEIIRAEALGAGFIKLFPGNILGPGFMSAIKELFPDILFMPTGGVELSNDSISAWFKAGVCAVGMGSKLLSKDVMDNKKYEELVAATKEAMAIVASCKTHSQLS